ncbi:universal stress protein [Billgrantia bachuensis]|uniref:Universal stress protein n=1 Tax=Billgrantia bachuensis TaxID=2717286 RepID=A0ABX0PPW1_9GAMM|nr:universal stress protein [Halomonas bachuensis]NIC04197.1 universal stress protein [Halomonas bachuensis]
MTNDDTLPDDPQKLQAARVLALLDASRHSLAALAAAVELASECHAELVALYVEDIDLLRCAAFPFSCEIGAQSGLTRPLTSGSLEVCIARQLQRVRQALSGAVAGRSLRHRLEVSRGQVTTAALDMARKDDVLVLGKTGTSEHWGPRLGSTSRRLVFEATCTVLLWDERQAVKRGPLRWLAASPGSSSPEQTATPALTEWLASLFEGAAPLPLRHAGDLESALTHAAAGGLLLHRHELTRLLEEEPELIAKVPLPIIITD